MKPWRSTIEQHVKRWSAGLGPRAWWPRFVYHFTDVRNAVEILKRGWLFSRDRATTEGLLTCDGASATVISQTLSEHKNFVRLYFRPGTPTQFRNEGIRPIEQRWRPGLGEPSAHLPVPVFFCFDAVETLGADGVCFSDGNMASSRVEYNDTCDLFKRLPFELIYHDGPFPPEESAKFKHHRHAEVLVPEQLSLEHLRWIICRSSAERQTLLALLPSEARGSWESRVRLGFEGLFFRRWTYVESVAGIE